MFFDENRGFIFRDLLVYFRRDLRDNIFNPSKSR